MADAGFSPAASSSGNFGLRRGVLSPFETLAQSISTIAPTATPVATIPLVAALAGNATWLAYALATVAILVVAWCVSRFAKYSASPGSLYTYSSKTLPAPLAAVAAWSLLLAYIATGSSIIGGFYHYANVVLQDFSLRARSPVALALFVTVIAVAVAWRDVKISARLMLWIEAVSVAAIVFVVLLVLFRHGMHFDLPQFRLQGATGTGLRLGLILALFSFVGFESASTLGAEAHDPLRTIPRAVIQSAIFCGSLFVVCAYTEILGFRLGRQNLGESPAPFHVLATVGGVPVLGLLIDVGALVSLVACALACVTAAARVLLLMAHNGLVPKAFARTHDRNATPTVATFAAGFAAVAPVAALAWRGFGGLDVYGWLGALATYGFIVAYALVCIALPSYLRSIGAGRSGAQAIPWLAFLAMLFALAGNLYPVQEGAYGKMPYIYLAYLALGMSWFLLAGRSTRAAAPSQS